MRAAAIMQSAAFHYVKMARRLPKARIAKRAAQMWACDTKRVSTRFSSDGIRMHKLLCCEVGAAQQNGSFRGWFDSSGASFCHDMFLKSANCYMLRAVLLRSGVLS